MLSVWFSRGVLFCLLLPSFVSSQSSTVASSQSPSPSSMSSSSVTMTTNSPSSTSMMSPSPTSSGSPSPTSSGSPSPSSSGSPSPSSPGSSSPTTAGGVIPATAPTSTMMMISCRNFTCDGSNCYTMFMTMNASMCPSSSNFCELRRWNMSMYSVGCVDSCDSCMNDTQVNCAVGCCNTTDCLNSTIWSMTNSPTTTANGTGGPDNSTMGGSDNSTISCRNFTCDGSNCYTMFMTMNASMCPSSSNFCELRRWNMSMYSVGCVDSCDSCMNDTQVYCAVGCCNTTDCLNSTIWSMTNPPTTTVATTTKPTTTATQTTRPVTIPNNGKMCKTFNCKGADCYQNVEPQTAWCIDQQNYCQLKKVEEGSTIEWTAGCANNCTSNTACSSTTKTCHQECCEATASGDCLKLNGTLNMPNSLATSTAVHSSTMFLAMLVTMWLLTEN